MHRNYPKLEEHVEAVLTKRSQLESDTVVGSSFSRFGSQWIYIRTLSANAADLVDARPLPHVEVFSVCLLSKVFNPEKYLAMAAMLGATYARSASPPAVLSAYVSRPQ
jgi:arginine exporter protein ArgO